MNNFSKKNLFWVFQIFFWLIYFLFEAEFIYGTYPADHKIVLAYCFLVALFGIPLSLLLKFIYEIKPIKNISKYYLLLIVVLSSVIISHLWLIEITTLDYFLTKLFGIPAGISYIREIIIDTIVLSIWSILYLLLDSWYELSVQQTNVEKAYLLAKNAQLNSLRYQLNPHFLFNALNSVRALIYKSPESADEMISKLSDFMRYSLTHKDELEVLLENEIDVINDYLNIEKIRFGDKLIFQIDIDSIANEYPILPFLILPLVDNAVKYGMKTSKMPLNISITAEVENEELLLKVKNTGSWVENNIDLGSVGTGTGLENIRKRLETFYHDKQSFTIQNNKDDVSIEIKINREISNEGTTED